MCLLQCTIIAFTLLIYLFSVIRYSMLKKTCVFGESPFSPDVSPTSISHQFSHPAVDNFGGGYCKSQWTLGQDLHSARLSKIKFKCQEQQYVANVLNANLHQKVLFSRRFALVTNCQLGFTNKAIKLRSHIISNSLVPVIWPGGWPRLCIA